MHLLRIRDGRAGPRSARLPSDEDVADDPLPSISVEIRSNHAPLTEQQRTAETALIRAIPGTVAVIRRYARLTLDSGRVRATRAEVLDSRTSARVAIQTDPGTLLEYGEVIHLLQVETHDTSAKLAFVRMFHVAERHPTFDVGEWSTTFALVPIDSITEVVAVLVLGRAHYVVRKRAWQSDANALQEAEDEADMRDDEESDDDLDLED
ncbi:hypothetical protein OC834_005254 [Tilletia horrida]|nr:hypothetical protein OC834_005254 [Tilletia horrida]